LENLRLEQGVDFSLIQKAYMKLNRYLLIFTAATIVSALVSSCKQEYINLSIPEGTRFSNITLKGYTVDDMQVHIGPRSVLAGNIFEEVSERTLEAPFAKEQGINEVVFYNASGTTAYAGSQINFLSTSKDTTVRIFYDGKTFTKNPVFPVVASGKMLVRLNFKSTASTYKGLVDLEFHAVTVVAGVPTIETTVAKLVEGVSSNQFTEYIELPAFSTSRQYYAVYVHLPGTLNPLPYPTTNVVVDPYIVFRTTARYAALIRIKDALITVKTPNQIQYFVDDIRSNYFQ